MDDVKPFPGPRVVTLLDGSLVFSDSDEWRQLTEARELARMTQSVRSAWLFDLERLRGVEATERLRKTIDEVIVVMAAEACA